MVTEMAIRLHGQRINRGLRVRSYLSLLIASLLPCTVSFIAAVSGDKCLLI